MALSSIAVALALLSGIHALDDGLARTPPMGWRSWNLFQDDIDQARMQRIMHAVAEPRVTPAGGKKSLCGLGYCDVGLDDAWQACGSYGAQWYTFHDPSGAPVINRTRFPDMNAMTRLAHRLGLTSSWYFNNCICRDHCERTRCYLGDVHALVEFEFDGVKLDGCSAQLDLNLWSRLLHEAGRPMVIENCHWGRTLPTRDWCPFHFYRTSADIAPRYDSVVRNLQTVNAAAVRNLSFPGCWAYGDMLEVGVLRDGERLTPAENRAHFAAWCVTSSPLTLSHDVADPEANAAVWDLIANEEAILVNQAYHGWSGSVYLEADETVALGDGVYPAWQFLYKPLNATAVAVVCMNHGAAPLPLRVGFAAIPGSPCAERCVVRDVWKRRDVGLFQGEFKGEAIESHDAAFLIIRAL